MRPDHDSLADRPLTAQDRARLRPTVDVAALERFLAAIPGPTRRVVLLSFMHDATQEELRAAAGFGPADFGGGVTPPAGAAADDFAIMVDPAASPELHRLWRAIEPAGPPSSGRAGSA